MSRNRRWQKYFQDCQAAAGTISPWTVSGRLTRVAGLVMEAVGLKLPVGNSCYVIAPSGQRVDAEVVGFSGDRLYLMPATDVYGLEPGALVMPVEAGAVMGSVTVSLGEEPVLQEPLAALDSVERGGFFRVFWDSIVLFFLKLFGQA